METLLEFKSMTLFLIADYTKDWKIVISTYIVCYLMLQAFTKMIQSKVLLSSIKMETCSANFIISLGQLHIKWLSSSTMKHWSTTWTNRLLF